MSGHSYMDFDVYKTRDGFFMGLKSFNYLIFALIYTF